MKRLYLFLIAILWCSCIVQGQLIKAIDSVAQAYVYKGFNGTIMYSHNDTIVFLGNYGYANVEEQLPLKPETVFELASVSKQFTALAIMQLVEKGQISLETKVAAILKDFPYPNIKVTHLLRHQSGLPDYQAWLANKKIWKPYQMASNTAVLQLLAQRKTPLQFYPGTQYAYNNTGYAVLASIITAVSGLSYADYLSKHIFEPAKMEHSGVYQGGAKRQQFTSVAEGYTPKKRNKGLQRVADDKNRRFVQWSNPVIGDRGVYASVLDLEQWKQALRYNTLITAASKEQMFTVDAVSPKYGYGFAIYQTQDKGKWVYHNGSWSGYKTTAIYLPEHNQYLVVLSNNRFLETYRSLEDDLYQIIK